MRVVSLLFCAASFLAAQNFYEPFPAPGRAEIFFVSGGDIWRVAEAGGEASLVVSHPADDTRPMPSPDGNFLAFQSTRTGAGDIYLLTLGSGELRRLTFDAGPEVLNGWSHDGKWIYFHSNARDISAMNDIYRVPATGGTPERVLADVYTNEFASAPSPDGKSLAYCARGVADRQWWRHGHSHLDESELWLKPASGAPQRLTPAGAKHLWPMWSADGSRLYYVSDEDGAENLWSLTPGQKPRKLTAFKDGRLLFPAISYDGKTIAFERNFRLYRYDVAANQSKEIAITLRGAPSSPQPERLRLTQGFSGLSVAPDGRKLAFVARGDVFASGTRDPGDAARITQTRSVEGNLAWSPDSKLLLYTADRDGGIQIVVYDFAARKERLLTQGKDKNSLPRWSPDGKRIAFLRNAKELRVIDADGAKDTLLATGRFTQAPLDFAFQPAWSPDSAWIAYIDRGEKNFENVSLVPAAGGTPKPVSFLPNTNSAGVTWAPDGEAIYFRTSQRTESALIVKVDLRIKGKPLREDRFDELFAPARKDDKKEEKKPVVIDWEGLRRRVSLLPLDLNAGAFAISPDGKTLVFTATAGQQAQLYSVSLDPLAPGPMIPRQLTTTPGPKSAPQFTADSKELYFLEAGKITALPMDTRVPRNLALTAELETNFESDKAELFDLAWGYLDRHFYDEKFHGTDWSATRERFERPAMASRTVDEFRRVVNLMIGELNASHLGFSGGQGTPPANGRLGLDFEPGTFKIARILPGGPAALAGGFETGMTLEAINQKPLNATDNLDERLEYASGKRTELRVSGKTITVQPVSVAAEKKLRYQAWVDENRKLVERLSAGKLSYAHIPDMSEESLNQFYLDLDADSHGRKGVVIDVRNNNGGFVNVYAIDVLARKSYFTMRERGDSEKVPSRTLLGQRALDLPTILLTNQHSLSDAEDFTEGYRALKLGKVVGEPTAGWIIFTWNLNLFDGSTLRLPRTAIADLNGQIMERNPRPVDVPVERPMGEGSTAKDSQIERAVAELLRQVNTTR